MIKWNLASLQTKGKVSAVLVTALLVMLAVWGGVVSLTPREKAPSAGTSICFGGTDSGQCEVRNKDATSRMDASSAIKDPAVNEAYAKIVGIVSEVVCVSPQGDPCYGRMPEIQPTQSDVDRIDRALTSAGYSGHVVRLALPQDPAVAGALIYAVPVEGACIIGDVEPPPGGVHHWIAGVLTSGGCLT